MVAYNPSKRGFGKMNTNYNISSFLTQDEFLDYKTRYLQGDKQAINYIIANYLEMVKNSVQKYENVDYDDYFSLGLTTLWKAIIDYDQEDIPFKDYVQQKLKRTFSAKYKKELRKSSKSNQKEPIYWDPINQFIDEETKKSVLHIVKTKLSRKQYVILKYYYHGLTMTEIGQKIGFTRAEVSRCHKEALQHLAYELYSEQLIDHLSSEKEYLAYRHNHPQTIYDLFIDYKIPRRLDNQLIDTLLYFATPATKETLKQGLGKDYCQKVLITDKYAYQKCTMLKSKYMQLLQTLTEEDIYEEDPVELTMRYLDIYGKNIEHYFNDSQTGKRLDNQFVNYLISNNQTLKAYLVSNGYNPYSKEVKFTSIYQWLRLKEFIPRFLKEFQRLTYSDIFNLDYEQLIECYQKCPRRTTGLVRELTNM